MTTALIEREIRDGAFTTSSGDPIVAVRECPGSWCAYCGAIITTQIAVTKAGMTVAAPGHCNMWRWFNNRFEPWHVDCFDRWVFHWTANPNGTVHIVGCRHAQPERPVFQGTRGEARHVIGDRFCNTCAPIELWCEPQDRQVPASRWKAPTPPASHQFSRGEIPASARTPEPDVSAGASA